MEIDNWLKDIIHGSGGFEDFENYEGLVHSVSREHSIAAFVIRCLGNPDCEGSGEVLDKIEANREPTWQVLQDELHEWTVEKFGNPSNPIPSLNHLREELEELIADPASPEEWADCFIILIHAARKAGFNMRSIRSFIIQKHEVNKNRRWSAPDENGVCHHIK